MRHRKTTPQLGRTPSHRKSMLRNLATALLRHERVRTTTAKAKAVRPLAERMITLGKRDTLHARRQAASVVRDKAVVKKIFDELAPRYAQRPGGYTRILRLPTRKGDRAEMAIIELVEAELTPKPKDKKKAAAAGPRTAAQDTAARVEEQDPEEAAAEAAPEAAEEETAPEAPEEGETRKAEAEAAREAAEGEEPDKDESEAEVEATAEEAVAEEADATEAEPADTEDEEPSEAKDEEEKSS